MNRLTDSERNAIIDAIRSGEPRNEIARRTGRSAGTITKIAHDEGLTFDRSQTNSATAARQADNAARRAALVTGLLEDAERLRGQLFSPTTVFSFGGRDNTYAERTLPEPTFADKRHIMGAVRMAVTTAVDLERHDHRDEDYAVVDRWLASMVGGQAAA